MPRRVVTYSQGIPTPNPRIIPTATALPSVWPSVSMSSWPASTASSMTNATMVASMSVSADSKLRTDLASSDMPTFLTKPNTMAELLPPTMEPSSMLSSHGQSMMKWAPADTIATETTNPPTTSAVAKWAVAAIRLMSRLRPPSNIMIMRARAAK